MNDYKIESRSRWGTTDAYREHEQKTKNYTKEKWAEANDGLMSIFAEFATLKIVVQVPNLPRHRRLLPSFRRTSPRTTTPAQTRFSQALARCMLQTSDSRRTSISTEMEPRSLRQKG